MRNLKTVAKRLKGWAVSLIKQPLRRGDFESLRQELSPIFVIGANRSGTSVVSSVLNQHPDLEGLFSGSLKPTYDSLGHSIGYCESEHIWPFLTSSNHERRRRNQLPYWGLPQYLSSTYRDAAKNDRERCRLLGEVERFRMTRKQPLIKDQFNTLRVGLITDIFPRARFVLVTRNWHSFIDRSMHKWTGDSAQVAIDFNHPWSGFHWHTLNLIARYELEIFAPGRYAEVWLDTLQEGEESARHSLQQMTAAVSLSPFDFDLSLLKSQWAKQKTTSSAGTHDFSSVKEIVHFERQHLANRHGNT